MKGQDVSTVERLRPLVGRGGWDYCVVWEVSQDQRFLELKSCCCGGTEHTASLHPGALILGGLLQPQLGFPPMARACRDGRSPQHPRTAACDALADLPARIPLDCSSSTTVHAQALVTGVPAWMYPSELRADCTGSNEATRATKVLVPVPGGLAELFVQNHVPEDQDVVNFVMSRFTNPDEASAFAAAADFQPFRGGLNCGMNTPTEISRSWVVAPTSIPSCDHPGFPWDLHAGQSRLCASSLNLFEGTPRDDDGFFEGSADSIHCERLPAHPVDSTVGVGVHGPITPQMSDIITTAAMAEYSTVTRELGGGGGGHEKESVKEEGEGRADSGMEGSDPGDDDEGGRSGRRLSSKNLLAERRRRKKLNDRLYTLRSLVPKISKMDRASILGDAIEFVKELQNQVKKLQEQLEETSPEDSGTKQAGHVNDKHVHPNNVDGRGNNNDTLQSPGGRRPEKLHQTGSISPEMENSSSPKRNGGYLTANASKQHRSSPATNEEKGNQMEPQVEVCQIGANKFHLKVFCEHKRGGFVRLMEAMASLGLDVTTVNVTTSTPLVLNIFEVEKRDGEVVQAEQLRSSLLRLGMDSEDAGWPGDSNMAVEKVGRGITTPVAAGRRTCLNTSMQVDSHQHAHHQHCLHQQLP